LTKVQLLLAGAVALVGAAVLPYLRAPNSDAHILAMRKALDEVPPPMRSILVESHEKPAWRIILVERIYKSDLGYDSLREYYRVRLEERGWRFAEEIPLRDLGRDFGGRDLLFCKPPYAANLQYIGKPVDSGASFILSVSWRLVAICNSKAARSL
jgi:hypothetical protein